MKNSIAYQLRYHARFVGEPLASWGAQLPPCAQEPRPEYVHTQWFETKESLAAILTSWCRNGWVYWLTDDDLTFNEKVPPSEFMEPTEDMPDDSYIQVYDGPNLRLRLIGTKMDGSYPEYVSELDRAITQSCLDMSRRRVFQMERALILIRDRDCNDVVDGTNEFQRLRDIAYNHIEAMKRKAGDALLN